MTPDTYKIKNALISVSDKTGIVEFATQLNKLGIIIYSTGGTAKLLAENNIPVKNVSDLTGFSEILDGRVKTLHPVIHAGLLADLNNEKHIKTMKQHNLISIDLVVVNLYPFEQVLKKEEEKEIDNISTEMIENIDIGGTAMLRSAAKNYKWTAVVTNPKHYQTILEHLNNNQSIPESFRLQLAGEVFNHTAHYDAIISSYFNKVNKIEFPETLTLTYNKAQDCRYGENPHQPAAVYGDFLNQFKVLHGKELSYNNVMDINSICELILEFHHKPTVAIVKHTNPCGVASANNFTEAYKLAFATDTTSPFGGIVALNGEVDEDFAKEIHPIFMEVIIATNFTDAALDILTKKKDRRLVIANYAQIKKKNVTYFRSLPNGMLYQHQDMPLFKSNGVKVVTNKRPNNDEIEKIIFAWKIVKHVKSNAIVYATKDRTLGIGAGQMSRVDSSRIAVEKAKINNLDLLGSVMASDAFLPFPDALMEAVNAGATIVIQPGGSIRDDEIIAEANKHEIIMCFTGMRHFKH
jgi:phosphoribosylaminoimidazolecarboxamide formyltransferase/IMP cyclohydrolase